MNEDKKMAWLERYAANRREAARLRLEITRWRSLAERTTRSIDSLPGGGAGGDALQGAVESMCQIAEELCGVLKARVALRREIEAAVTEVERPDERLGEVLRLRYLDGCKWREVAKRMHYSEMQVMRLHRRALEALQVPEDVNGVYITRESCAATVGLPADDGKAAIAEEALRENVLHFPAAEVDEAV